MERGGKNYFLLNVNQTREVVIDFRRKTTASRLLSVLGQDVDVTEERKVPGHLHRQQAELEYKQRNCAQKRGMNRFYSQWKLRSFCVCRKTMEFFFFTSELCSVQCTLLRHQRKLSL